MVIPALNRDGDILSDLVLPLFGSIAGSESMLVAFGDDYVPSALMAEAAHGTAPSLFGKDVANPMAMILACAALLGHADDERRPDGRARDPGRRASRRSRRGSAPPTSAATPGTIEFTDEVIAADAGEARGVGLALSAVETRLSESARPSETKL